MQTKIMKRLKPPTFVKGTLVVVVVDCHDFRMSIVRIVISVSNVRSPKDCLCNCKKNVKDFKLAENPPKSGKLTTQMSIS